MSGTLRVSGVNYGIVVNYDYAITSRVHIELNAIGAELDGALATVGDALRGVTAAACDQTFLSVVAFCSMSAKDMSARVQGQSALTAGCLERLPDEAP